MDCTACDKNDVLLQVLVKEQGNQGERLGLERYKLRLLLNLVLAGHCSCYFITALNN